MSQMLSELFPEFQGKLLAIFPEDDWHMEISFQLLQI